VLAKGGVVQAAEPLALCVPTLHALQVVAEDAPTAAEKVLALHGLQATSPAASE
jgi:hypothetical protein